MVDVERYPALDAAITEMNESKTWLSEFMRNPAQHLSWSVRAQTRVSRHSEVPEFIEASRDAWRVVAATCMLSVTVVGDAPCFDVPGGVTRIQFSQQGFYIQFRFAATSSLDWRPLGALSHTDARLLSNAGLEMMSRQISPTGDDALTRALREFVMASQPSPHNVYATLATMRERARVLYRQLDAVHRHWCACAHCGRDAATQRCARCVVTLYCDRTCQSAHWHTQHRSECAPLQRLHESARLTWPVPPSTDTLPPDAFFEASQECFDVLRREAARALARH